MSDKIVIRSLEDLAQLGQLGRKMSLAEYGARMDGDIKDAEIDRLTRERDEARSKETDYREGFEEGWAAAQRGAAAVVEQMREALSEWDALIQHQYSGSRGAMTDMQYAALKTKRILDELDAPKALEAKP